MAAVLAGLDVEGMGSHLLDIALFDIMLCDVILPYVQGVSANVDKEASAKTTKFTKKRLMLYSSLPRGRHKKVHTSFHNSVLN